MRKKEHKKLMCNYKCDKSIILMSPYTLQWIKKKKVLIFHGAFLSPIYHVTCPYFLLLKSVNPTDQTKVRHIQVVRDSLHYTLA